MITAEPDAEFVFSLTADTVFKSSVVIFVAPHWITKSFNMSSVITPLVEIPIPVKVLPFARISTRNTLSIFETVRPIVVKELKSPENAAPGITMKA
ncbi:MAG: hypothetical protein IJ637_06285 [Prevotella sp.]|nr:hypothetical protein [Prevotella sp.]